MKISGSNITPSPCIHVCNIDHNSGLCLGCARTLSEIAQWSAMTDDEKASLIKLLPERHRLLEKKET